MKNYIRPFLIALFLFSALTSGKSQSVYNIAVKDLNGSITTLSEITEADFVVLDFWATWCKPCVKSIPKLVELSEKFPSEKIAFVGINEDSPRNQNKVKPFVNSLGVSYPVLLDSDQEMMNELLVSSFPTLIVIDRDASIKYIHEGYTPGDEAIIEEEINKLLKKNE